MVLGQGAVVGGALEVGVDGGAGWEVDRELAPLAAAVVDVADRVDELAFAVLGRAPAAAFQPGR